MQPKDWEDPGSSGVTYAAYLEIRMLLSPDHHPLTFKEVFIHELMHACVATTGHTYSIRHVKKSDAEEVMIQGLAPSLLAVLRNNPKVREFLLGA
jgi:hypothetical protein